MSDRMPNECSIPASTLNRNGDSMKLSKLEQETIITWNEAETYAEVYTCNSALQRQLSGLCQSHPEQVRQSRAGSCGSITFQLPKKWLKVSPPRKPSPAQLEVLARMTQKRLRRS